jgi:hypothetical protein
MLGMIDHEGAIAVQWREVARCAMRPPVDRHVHQWRRTCGAAPDGRCAAMALMRLAMVTAETMFLRPGQSQGLATSEALRGESKRPSSPAVAMARSKATSID